MLELELQKAITTEYADSELYDDSTKLYFKRAPDNAKMPYVVYQIVSSKGENTYADSYEYTYIQFSAFCTGATRYMDAWMMNNSIRSLYDPATLTLDTGEVVAAVWIDTVDFEEDNSVYGVHTTYKILSEV